jgi:protein-L-isoaspartate(D-aspartate) O-methyltransferase
MTNKEDVRLEAVRVLYARLAAGHADRGELRERLEQAFAFVPREHFLGRGPWHVSTFGRDGPTYLETPTPDPIHVYQNVLFALDREKGINNGEPWLHGQMLGALDPDRGDTVLHVGSGTGYYTAILAQLVGPSGRVIAYEVEPALAERARACLEPWDNVSVAEASGTGVRLPHANAVYVNAGATRPEPGWLDALHDGGRLVFPMAGGGPGRWGATLAITRLGVEYAVRIIGRSGFIGCLGAVDEAEGMEVSRAIREGGLFKARRLVRDDSPDASAVLKGRGWWLSSTPVA